MKRLEWTQCFKKIHTWDQESSFKKLNIIVHSEIELFEMKKTMLERNYSCRVFQFNRCIFRQIYAQFFS